MQGLINSPGGPFGPSGPHGPKPGSREEQLFMNPSSAKTFFKIVVFPLSKFIKNPIRTISS